MRYINILLAVLVLWDQTSSGAADPVHVSDVSRVEKTWCSDQEALHTRLDAVEKRVEDIVDHLQTEVKVLLDKIEAPDWNFPDVPEGPKIDILDSDSN